MTALPRDLLDAVDAVTSTAGLPVPEVSVREDEDGDLGQLVMRQRGAERRLLAGMVRLAVEEICGTSLRAHAAELAEQLFADQLLTYDEVASEAGVSAQTIARLVRSGRLRSYTLGMNLRRIRRRDWQDFIASETADGDTAAAAGDDEAAA